MKKKRLNKSQESSMFMHHKDTAFEHALSKRIPAQNGICPHSVYVSHSARKRILASNIR